MYMRRIGAFISSSRELSCIILHDFPYQPTAEKGTRLECEYIRTYIVYARAVYIARVNRRVRLVVDGLVAAMAHLWSKFTKCLRPSEGAFDPRPLPSPECRPFERTMPRHSLLLRRCYHHLAEATRSSLPSSIACPSSHGYILAGEMVVGKFRRATNT